MKKKLLILVTVLCLLISAVAMSEALPKEEPLPSESFRTMLSENPEIELYMRESIGLAAKENPDSIDAAVVAVQKDDFDIKKAYNLKKYYKI